MLHSREYSPTRAQPRFTIRAMAISVFRLPDLGEGLAEADVVEWYVAEGESVALDQPVVALESAKAVVDIPSPVAGRVRRHCARPGETVATGAPLVEFEIDAGVRSGASGDLPDGASPSATAAASASHAGAVGAVDASASGAGARPIPDGRGGSGSAAGVSEHPLSADSDGYSAPTDRHLPSAEANVEERPAPDERSRPGSPGIPSRVNAMPAARAKARALDVDLASVAGSGPGGRIRVADVERAAERAGRCAGAETLRGVRRTMAERMALSLARVVPVTVTEDADIGDWGADEDVTVRLVRAVVAGCAASPALNAWFEDHPPRRTLHRSVHLGIAADTGDGLFVPVLRDAGAREPAQWRAEVDRLRAGLAARSLAPDELDGATITLSNFGMLAGRYATPIVVPPQVAILGAGRAREEPVARDGEISVRRRMPLSLTFDHRACTGAESSRFLAAVVADLERGA